jgi:hypothetical protein
MVFSAMAGWWSEWKVLKLELMDGLNLNFMASCGGIVDFSGVGVVEKISSYG